MTVISGMEWNHDIAKRNKKEKKFLHENSTRKRKKERERERERKNKMSNALV